jgi:hypothetical protein
MFKVKIECRNVRCERVAKFLARFRKDFPFGYKVWLQDNKIFAAFMLESVSDLNDLIRRLRYMHTSFKFHQILRVQIRRTKDRYTPWHKTWTPPYKD